MPPGRSPSRPCLADRPELGRPAIDLPKTLPVHHHTLGDSPMDPKHLGDMLKAKLRPEGLIYSLQWASEVAS
jgi:hypothetical protein